MSRAQVWKIIVAVLPVVVALATGAVYVGGLQQRVITNEKAISTLNESPEKLVKQFAELQEKLDTKAVQATTAVIQRLALPNESSRIEVQFNRAGDWGRWSEIRMCPAKTYVCGMRQKIEPPQGGGYGDDDTAMNAVAFYCCPLIADEEEIDAATS